MKILVTGSSGYIGSHLIQLLTSNFSHECQIVGLDPASPRIEIAFDNYHHIPISILESQLLENLFSELKFDYVVHLAALKNIKVGELESQKYIETNELASANLARLSMKYAVKKFIFSSSAAVYKMESKSSFISENGSVLPLSVYGRTKRHTEIFLSEMKKKGELDSVSLRFFNAVGANEAFRPLIFDSNIVPQVCRSLLLGETLNLYGHNLDTSDGSAIRDFIDVRDISTAILQLITNDEYLVDPIFNLCSGIGTSMLEIIKYLEEYSGQKLLINYLPHHPKEIASVIGSSKLIKDRLRWTPTYTVSESLKDAWSSYYYSFKRGNFI